MRAFLNLGGGKSPPKFVIMKCDYKYSTKVFDSLIILCLAKLIIIFEKKYFEIRYVVSYLSRHNEQLVSPLNL